MLVRLSQDKETLQMWARTPEYHGEAIALRIRGEKMVFEFGKKEDSGAFLYASQNYVEVEELPLDDTVTTPKLRAA